MKERIIHSNITIPPDNESAIISQPGKRPLMELLLSNLKSANAIFFVERRKSMPSKHFEHDLSGIKSFILLAITVIAGATHGRPMAIVVPATGKRLV